MKVNKTPENQLSINSALCANKKERVRAYQKKYRLENKDKCSNHKREWRKNNAERNRAWALAWYYKRKADPCFVISMRLRARLRNAITHAGTKKYSKTMALVGCDREQLIKHIESTFKPGMGWDNIGKWELDHKVPVSSFDLTNKDSQEKCFHFTNLEALWAFDNRSKGAKITV